MLNQRIDRTELADDRLVLLIFMVEHFGVLEMLNQGSKTLEPSVGQVANLLAFKFTPTLVMEAMVELTQIVSVQEIDEAIPNIAVILDITGKIKEIVAIGVLPIDLLGERLNCVLVGNVFDHESGSPISADTAHIYHEIIGIIIPSFIVVNHVVLLIHLRKVA